MTVKILPTGTSLRETFIFTESVDVVPLPAWFDPMRDMVYFSGCGGGGGAGGPTAASMGLGGGAGAVAMRHPVVLWPGCTGLKLMVGAAGVGGTTGVNGTSGGTTSLISLPDNIYFIQLGGGSFGRYDVETGLNSGIGGKPSYFGQTINAHKSYGIVGALSNKHFAKLTEMQLHTQPTSLRYGISAYRDPTTGTVANISPTDSPSAPAATPYGGSVNLNGYGYGGPRAAARVAGTGANGGAGIAILEFVEGLNYG